MKAKIPKGQESLARIGLGTYRTFDVSPSAENIYELDVLLKTFIDLGGRLIDTSPMYGRSETVIGHLLERLQMENKNLPQALFIATKVWTQGKDHGVSQMLDSFQKLRREKIELMQIHNLVDWKIHLQTLKKMKAEGSIKYIGVTHYNEAAFPELERILRNEDDIDFLQIPYNIIRSSAEDILIPLAHEKNIAVIANEPFDQGGIINKLKGQKIPVWAKEYAIESWAQYLLKFILSDQRIQFVIPATQKLEHLKENMSAQEGPLLPESIRKMMAQHVLTLL